MPVMGVRMQHMRWENQDRFAWLQEQADHLEKVCRARTEKIQEFLEKDEADAQFIARMQVNAAQGADGPEYLDRTSRQIDQGQK